MPALTTRFWRKKAVLVKIETTYGVDAIPTGAANAVEARNVSFTPMKNKMVDQNIDLPYLGSQVQIAVGTEVNLNFDVALAGSGTAGTAPAYGPLLRSAGMSETVSAGVSAVYAPISASFESATVYINIDGVNHKLLGCRADVGIKLPGAAIPLYSFKITGLYGGIADTALPALTMTAWQKPLAVNNVNTGTFSLHGFATALYDLNIQMGNQVLHRDNIIGLEDVLITDRKAAGDLTIQAPKQAEKDFYALAQAAVTGSLTVTHGTAAGNKVVIASPGVQVLDPSLSDSSGVAAMKLGLRFVPSAAGNDELSITVQ